MFRRSVPNESGFILKPRTRAVATLAAMAAFLAVAAPLQAADPIPVTVGAGLQTSFVHTGKSTIDSTVTGGSFDRFMINSARIYINGTAAPNIKFMFNTEYDGSNKIGVLDAAARYEPSPKFNLWMGRMLPPSDRANLYGPYYSHEWNTYTDGIQDGYPFLATGRDNGFLFWGDYNKVKVSAGAYDGPTTTGKPKVLLAGRVQVDFWDPEAGYYLNGTYYGGKNLLAIGVAAQTQASGIPNQSNTATTADFLMERKMSDGGVVSVESEFSYYDRLGGYNGRYGLSRGAYVLGSYMFGKKVGTGNIEIQGKYANASFARGATAFDLYYKQKTTEINLNYIIKEFNARVMGFYKDTRFTAVPTTFGPPKSWQAGVGLQIQM